MAATTPEEDERFYRDTEAIAFPKLDDRQLSLLEPIGQRRNLKRGDFIFKAGQRDLGLTIVLGGELEAVEQRDDTEQILATARERDFVGDVSMLQGTSALATVRVRPTPQERPGRSRSQVILFYRNNYWTFNPFRRIIPRCCRVERIALPGGGG